ncbi:cytochrome c oxidase copper chaperone 1-like [Teleopsis dalmanni]|uniref:cytochrome c oxidase copper chaperone 1-like n=1 Tax=Teleopsis dalmanni TaxID=139649 RepID=UPI0018CD320F|nr:cytochrome c oxidase copper chaperone 1-like [Teleopsis dalmanni]XP_037942157.1 cytochrome c oxidase copper chaperone 1-like [Teleopsis dalmanni]
MGNAPVKEVSQAAAVSAASGETKPKCKACCACPETKRARDQCILEHGEPNCSSLIEAHKQCMRDQGFNI